MKHTTRAEKYRRSAIRHYDDNNSNIAIEVADAVSLGIVNMGAAQPCSDAIAKVQVARGAEDVNAYFRLYINDEEFDDFTPSQRAGVVWHEFNHILHGHLKHFRNPPAGCDNERRLTVAQEIVCNDTVLHHGAELPQMDAILHGPRILGYNTFPKNTEEVYALLTDEIVDKFFPPCPQCEKEKREKEKQDSSDQSDDADDQKDDSSKDDSPKDDSSEEDVQGESSQGESGEDKARGESSQDNSSQGDSGEDDSDQSGEGDSGEGDSQSEQSGEGDSQGESDGSQSDSQGDSSEGGSGNKGGCASSGHSHGSDSSDSQGDPSDSQGDSGEGDSDGDSGAPGNGHTCDKHCGGVRIDPNVTAEDLRDILSDLLDDMSKEDIENIVGQLMDDIANSKMAGQGGIGRDSFLNYKYDVDADWLEILRMVDPRIAHGIEGMVGMQTTYSQWHRRPFWQYGAEDVGRLPIYTPYEDPYDGDDNAKPVVVIAVDQSGSIGEEVARKARELATTIPPSIAEAYACVFADRSAEMDLEDGFINGDTGGGTNFSAIDSYVQSLEDRDIDIDNVSVIVFTDGYASFMSGIPDNVENYWWINVFPHQQDSFRECVIQATGDAVEEEALISAADVCEGFD